MLLQDSTYHDENLEKVKVFTLSWKVFTLLKKIIQNSHYIFANTFFP